MYFCSYLANQSSIVVSEHFSLGEDISVHSMGHSILPRSHTLCVKRNLYALHFVLSGTGTLYDEPITGPIAFLMTPETQQRFHVSDDPDAPDWEHYWILFNGKKASEYLEQAGIGASSGSFPFLYKTELERIFRFLFNFDKYRANDDQFFLAAQLFRVFALHKYHSEDHKDKTCVTNDYVKNAIAFIKSKYMQRIAVSDIAAAVHISEKYLRKLFAKDLGVSPQTYLTDYRIQCAIKLLETTNDSMIEISEKTGFSSPEYFIRVFRKTVGDSPLKYRKNLC